MMNKRALNYLVGSQIMYIVTLLVCFCIQPSILLENRAISLYGSQVRTFVPYVIGLLLSAFFIFKAAKLLPKDLPENQTLSKSLTILTILLIGVTITPYTLNSILFYLHAMFAFLLFLFELGLGLWLVIKARKDLLDVVLLFVQAIGFVISVLSLGEIKVLRLLVVGQLIAVWAFALLLTRAVYQIEMVNKKNGSKPS